MSQKKALGVTNFCLHIIQGQIFLYKNVFLTDQKQISNFENQDGFKPDTYHSEGHHIMGYFVGENRTRKIF